MSISKQQAELNKITNAARHTVGYAPAHWARILDRELRARGFEEPKMVWKKATKALGKEAIILRRSSNRYGPSTNMTASLPI